MAAPVGLRPVGRRDPGRGGRSSVTARLGYSSAVPRKKDSNEARRERAEAQFQKAQRADDERASLKAEDAAKARAVDEKTARLKALRLARDAAEVEGKAAKTPKPKQR
jgi:hypothetical protein